MKVPVSVKLPLPLDISANVIKVMGSIYPETTVEMDNGKGEMVFWITDTDRDRQLDSSTAPEFEGEFISSSAQAEAVLAEIRDGRFEMGMPEWFSTLMVGALGDILEETSAENYLEMSVSSEGKAYTVVACRSETQTPHRLRQAAEEKLRLERVRVRSLEDKLRELGVDPADI